jgi:hypothetical protein
VALLSVVTSSAVFTAGQFSWRLLLSTVLTGERCY